MPSSHYTKEMDPSDEYLKLQESIKCLDELQTTMASINDLAKNLNEENLKIVIREISADATSNRDQNYVSLPYEYHHDFKKCIENVCTIRPKLVAYTSGLKYCASIDAENVHKLINERVDKINDVSKALEEKLQNVAAKIDDLNL